MRISIVTFTGVVLMPLVLLLAGAAFLLAAVASVQGGEPTAEAVADIPAELLPVYREAASATCGMPWAVLAAIGKTESDHGRSTLPGVHSGANYAGAMGPMQFMPATWAAMGVDGDRDGITDVYDAVDAIWGAANYLCHEGAGDPARLRAAILHYSGGDSAYVDVCLAIAARYAIAGNGSASVVGEYALPLERSWFANDPALLSRPHHCCTPATDLSVPVGTPTFAATSGVAARIDEIDGCGWGYEIRGDDDMSYVYCHLSDSVVAAGSTVRAGELLGYTGGARGAPGSGNSTGPHLHFGIRSGGVAYCPQPILQAWFSGQAISPGALATTVGCTA